MERQELAGLVDREVAVSLRNVEAAGVEIVATLDGVRTDGIVLREVGELGPGPTVFCPWESLYGVRRRPPWLRPPHEEPAAEALGHGGSYYMREASAEEAEPEPPERRREPSARNLERVVPVAQKRTVGAITVALTSLELHGGGVGVLGWRISMGEEEFRDEPDFHFGIPEPMLEVLADDGRELPWSPRGAGASDGESDGEAEVWDLPETGELRVTVTRLAADAYGPEGDHLGEGASVDGPWDFRFSL